jgi:hypothetical protein
VRLSNDLPTSPFCYGDIASRQQMVVRWYIVNWISFNVHPHLLREDLGREIAALVEQCTSAAMNVGISLADIEAETGCDPTDLILAAFLVGWDPECGTGGSA